MKTFLLRNGMLLLPVVFIFSCSEEHARLDSKKMQFTFSLPIENSGGRTRVDLPDGASLLISLEKGNGEVILEQHQIALQKEGDSYVSATIELANGNYNIIDFRVVDDSLKVLFATPRKGSPLSAKIAQALPYRFISDESSGSHLRIEVLDARMKTSKSFGYSSFRKSSHSLKLQVFIPKGKTMQMTNAEALLMKGLDTLEIYPLSTKMNTLTFNGDVGETYTLVVVKDAYTRFAHDFTVNALKKKHNPLKVVLEPALTVVAIPIQDRNYFVLQFDALGNFEFKVDWGDGTSELWGSGITTELSHYYQEPGKYFVSVTGHALDSVSLVGDIGVGNIERFGMEHLINLREFRMEWAPGPKTIDLSHNPLITEIRTFNAAVEDLIIPNHATIRLMELVGATRLKKESLDEIINDLHYQATNSPSGDFSYVFSYSMPFSDDIPILEPSPESLEKLSDLKNVYGWTVIPDPDL